MVWVLFLGGGGACGLSVVEVSGGGVGWRFWGGESAFR